MDVRFIAATNRDLEKMMEVKEFREDLYYRLNVVTIWIPPLRERRQDILPLADFFLRKFSGDINKDVHDFEPGAAKLLMEYNWPGNIRELENTIERAIIMTDGKRIHKRDLALNNDHELEHKGDLDIDVAFPPEGVDLEDVEKHMIVKALDASNWVQKTAAALLRLTPRALNYKIKKHGITHTGWKSNK